MASQIYVEYGNEAEFGKYPFSSSASMADSDGRTVPDDFIVDASLYPVSGLCSLSSTVSDGATCTLAVSAGDSKLSGSFSAGDRSCELYDELGFHAGTIVLGRGSGPYLLENGTRLFESMQFCISCQHAVGKHGVTSVSIDGLGAKIRGDMAFSWSLDDVARVEAVVGRNQDGSSTLRFDVVPNSGILSRGENGIRTIYVCRKPGSRFGVMRTGYNGERPYLYLTRDGHFRQSSLLDRGLICLNSNQASVDYDKRSSYDDCGASKSDSKTTAVEQERYANASWCFPSTGYSPYSLGGGDPVITCLWHYMSGGIGAEYIADGDDSLWNARQIVSNGVALQPMTRAEWQEYGTIRDLSQADRDVAYELYIHDKTEEYGGVRPPWQNLTGGGPGYWDAYGSYYSSGVRLAGFTEQSSMSCFFVEESMYARAFAYDAANVGVSLRWFATSAAGSLFYAPETREYPSMASFPAAGESPWSHDVWYKAADTGMLYLWNPVGEGSYAGLVQDGPAVDRVHGRELHGEYLVVVKAGAYRAFYSYFLSASSPGSEPGGVGYMGPVEFGELCYRNGWLAGRWEPVGDSSGGVFDVTDGYYADGRFYSGQDMSDEIVPPVVSGLHRGPQKACRDIPTGGLYVWVLSDSVDPGHTRQELAEDMEALADGLRTAYEPYGVDLTASNLLYINRARDMFAHFGCRNWELSSAGSLGTEIRHLVGWGSKGEFWDGGNSYFKFQNTDGKDAYLPKWTVARYVWWKKHCKTADIGYGLATGGNIVRGYYSGAGFYEDSGYTTEITPEAGKTYVDIVSGFAYSWSNGSYVLRRWMRYFIVPEERGLCFFVGDYFKDGVRSNGKEESYLGWDCYGIPPFLSRGDVSYGYMSDSFNDPGVLGKIRAALHADIDADSYDPTDPDGLGQPDSIFNPLLGEFSSASTSIDALDNMVRNEFLAWDADHPFSDMKIIEPYQAPVAPNDATYGVDGGNPYDYGGAYRLGPFEFKYGGVYIEGRGYPDIYDPDGRKYEKELLDNKSMYFFRFDTSKLSGNSFNFDTTDMTAEGVSYANPVHITASPSVVAPMSVDVDDPSDVSDVSEKVRGLTERSTEGNGITISIPGIL